MLTVQIKGVAGAGKTALAAVIHKALREHGYNVAAYDEHISGRAQTTHIEEYTPKENDGRSVEIEVEVR